MCHSIPVTRALQQAIPNNCSAKTLTPDERLSLGVQALTGHQSITCLANDADVSHKFVYQQRDRAQAALVDAFAPTVADDPVRSSRTSTAGCEAIFSCAGKSARAIWSCCNSSAIIAVFYVANDRSAWTKASPNY